MSEAFKIEDVFAENVFTVSKMKERLPKQVFKNLKKVWKHWNNSALLMPYIVEGYFKTIGGDQL